ncbi:MAG: hypothetical protein M1816_005923 [Peltula sp. TS41687]|nr:MAG: hypothetical protein M1816_005923 [Peltula sp. TS41687]
MAETSDSNHERHWLAQMISGGPPFLLIYMINHVFLPLKLPQQDDHDLVKSNTLTEALLATLKLFQARLPEQDPGLSTERLRITLNDILNRDVVGLHIRGHNSGVLIRRLRDQYSFETFELSPTNYAVIGTKGRLRRCFPGPAVVVSRDRIADPNFRQSLAPFRCFLSEGASAGAVNPFAGKLLIARQAANNKGTCHWRSDQGLRSLAAVDPSMQIGGLEYVTTSISFKRCDGSKQHGRKSQKSVFKLEIIRD